MDIKNSLYPGKAKYYKNTKSNAIKILRVLKKSHDIGEGHISVSEIARRTGLHRWTVSRTLDLWMGHFIEMVIPEELEHVGLRIKLVRLLDPEISEKAMLRAMSVKI
jgi:hypothetical protein